VATELTYSAAFAEGVAEEMASNPDIFVIGTIVSYAAGVVKAMQAADVLAEKGTSVSGGGTSPNGRST
jgi:pyruvate/2-oxoglutarate/acetoin dehydrogenase E1 component